VAAGFTVAALDAPPTVAVAAAESLGFRGVVDDGIEGVVGVVVVVVVDDAAVDGVAAVEVDCTVDADAI